MAELERFSRLHQVEHYLGIRQYRKAADLVQQLLAEEPDNGHLHYLLAVCCYQEDHYAESLVLCREALVRGAPLGATERLMGSSYLALARFADAETHFLAALRHDPRDASAMAQYAWLLLRTGHHKKGRRVLDEALRLDPEDDLVMRIRFLFHLGHSEQSDELQALERYIANGDDEVQKLVTTGLSALYRGRYTEARENFRLAYLKQPNDRYLLESLQSLELTAHPLYAPITWATKLGGTAPIWIGAMVLIFGTRYLGYPRLSAIVAGVYVAFCVYTWVVPPLLRRWLQRR